MRLLKRELDRSGGWRRVDGQDGPRLRRVQAFLERKRVGRGGVEHLRLGTCPRTVRFDVSRPSVRVRSAIMKDQYTGVLALDDDEGGQLYATWSRSRKRLIVTVSR